jgi:hypothetical protein
MSRKAHGARRTRHPASDRSNRPGDIIEAPVAYAFLVRLWREAREYPERRPTWRGTVSDLQGHHLGSFGSVLEFGDILARATGASELLLRGGDDPEPH